MSRARAAARTPVLVANLQRRLRVPPGFVARVARASLRAGRWRAGRVEVSLVDDATLRRLHRAFLSDPRPTDVLAFDYRGGRGPRRGAAAEVLVSAERAIREARRRRHAPLEELALYVAHGCLHLCGRRDGSPAEAREMRAAEARALRRAGVAHRFAPAPPL